MLQHTQPKVTSSPRGVVIHYQNIELRATSCEGGYLHEKLISISQKNDIHILISGDDILFYLYRLESVDNIDNSNFLSKLQSIVVNRMEKLCVCVFTCVCVYMCVRDKIETNGRRFVPIFNPVRSGYSPDSVIHVSGYSRWTEKHHRWENQT